MCITWCITLMRITWCIMLVTLVNVQSKTLNDVSLGRQDDDIINGRQNDDVIDSYSLEIRPVGHAVMWTGSESLISITVVRPLTLAKKTLKERVCLRVTTSDVTLFNVTDNVTCLPGGTVTHEVMTSEEQYTDSLPSNQRGRNNEGNSAQQIYTDYQKFSNLTVNIVTGQRTGHGWLNLELITNSHGSMTSHTQFRVTVVKQDGQERVVTFLVTCIVQLMTLLFIGLRIRAPELKEIMLRPYDLIASTIIQTVLVPLACIGVSIALNGSAHSFVCYVIIAACPASILTPMVTILQHGHIELSGTLLLLQTATAIGAVPVWLFIHSVFLGVPYMTSSFQFWLLGGALLSVASPLFIGLALQYCVSSNFQKTLERFLHPIGLLVAIGMTAVSTYQFSSVWNLIEWSDMASSIITVCLSSLAGGIVMMSFRQSLPQNKSVVIAAGIQNTALATLLIHYNFYTEPVDSSAPLNEEGTNIGLIFPNHSLADVTLMQVALACFDFTTWSVVWVAYVIHIITWTSSPSYRTLHDHITTPSGTGNGFYRQMAQKLFRSMIKSGEITFRRKQSAVVHNEVEDRGGSKSIEIPLSISASPSSSGGFSHKDRDNEHQGSISQGFCNSSFGSKVLVVSCDSIVRSQDKVHQPASSQPSTISGGARGGTSSSENRTNSSDNRTTSYNVSMTYSSGANSPVVNALLEVVHSKSPAISCIGYEVKYNKNETETEETKSLSIDYEMLGGVSNNSAHTPARGLTETRSGNVSELERSESDVKSARDGSTVYEDVPKLTKVAKSHLKIFDQLFAQLQSKHP